MNVSDLIIILIANETRGRIVGRTLLQKKLFFLNEKIKETIRFVPHYYGPYSREISETIDSLVSAGIIRERAESFPQFETPWGDSTRYSYDFPNDLRETIISLVTKKIGQIKYDEICKTIKQINERPEAYDYRALSIAAKVLQILKQKSSLRVDDFPKEAKNLGWKLAVSDVKKAAHFLQGLGLIS
jgi:uncharacterized protein